MEGVFCACLIKQSKNKEMFVFILWTLLITHCLMELLWLQPSHANIEAHIRDSTCPVMPSDSHCDIHANTWL